MDEKLQEFQQTVWKYYDQHERHELPWRQPEIDGSFDPYKIMVSEIMLQQTQVNRVIPKYLAFLGQFPTVQALAKSELGEVLRAWQGLGYNRRAKFLWQAAQTITSEYNGQFPTDDTELVKLPGIGKNTAGAIMAYAFNKPVVFIETNIRTAFIHGFFQTQTVVEDAEILKMVQKALPRDPKLAREWYWALMDYGSHLKQKIGNLNKLSKHYVKQSTFHGSKRQIRGAVIRELSKRPATLPFLQQQIADERLEEVLTELVREELIRYDSGKYSL